MHSLARWRRKDRIQAERISRRFEMAKDHLVTYRCHVFSVPSVRNINHGVVCFFCTMLGLNDKLGKYHPGASWLEIFGDVWQELDEDIGQEI